MARDRLRTIRRRVYQVLEQGPVGDRTSKTVDRFLVVLILVNLIAVSLETIPQYEARYATGFAAIEFFSLIVFTIEYGLRCGALSNMDRINTCLRGMRGSSMR
jgi:voltage-gated potassium channel